TSARAGARVDGARPAGGTRRAAAAAPGTARGLAARAVPGSGRGAAAALPRTRRTLTALAALRRRARALRRRTTAALAAAAARRARPAVGRGGAALRLRLRRRDVRRAHVLRDLADEALDRRVAGRHGLRLGRDLRLAREVAHVAALLREHDGDDDALRARARRAARAVQVRLVLGRRVHVHDQLDVVDVDAACGDVRRDEHLDRARGERLEVTLARALAEVAVQVDGGHARGRELLGELLRLVLGAHEQHAATGARGELVHDLLLRVRVAHREDVVRHLRGRGRGVVHRVAHRVAEVALDELVHAVVERRGEQHALPVLRGLVHDALHAGQEPEVGHVVRLVEHGDLDAVEREQALVEEVLEAAGARDDDVPALVERRDLARLRDAAEDRRRHEAEGLRDRLHGGVDLVGELARRAQHEGARPARVARRLGPRQARDGRQREREGLAGAGAAAAQDVAALERVGQRGGLDGEGGVDPLARELAHDGGGQAEIGKGSHR